MATRDPGQTVPMADLLKLLHIGIPTTLRALNTARNRELGTRVGLAEGVGRLTGMLSGRHRRAAKASLTPAARSTCTAR
jgi:hypothetical protein